MSQDTTTKPMTEFQESVALLLLQDFMPDEIAVRLDVSSRRVRRAITELREEHGVKTIHALCAVLGYCDMADNMFDIIRKRQKSQEGAA